MTASTAPPAGTPPVQGDTAAGFTRVAIAAPTTRVDLALPTAVPLVALLPADFRCLNTDWWEALVFFLGRVTVSSRLLIMDWERFWLLQTDSRWIFLGGSIFFCGF